MLKHISWAEYEREWDMFFCLTNNAGKQHHRIHFSHICLKKRETRDQGLRLRGEEKGLSLTFSPLEMVLLK